METTKIQQNNNKNCPSKAEFASPKNTNGKVARSSELNDAVSDEKIMLAVYNIG